MALKVGLMALSGPERSALLVAAAVAQVAAAVEAAHAELVWLADDAVVAALRARHPDLAERLGWPFEANVRGWLRLTDELDDHPGERRLWVVAGALPVVNGRRQLIAGENGREPITLSEFCAVLSRMDPARPLVLVVDVPDTAAALKRTPRLVALTATGRAWAGQSLTSTLCAALAQGPVALAAWAEIAVPPRATLVLVGTPRADVHLLPLPGPPPPAPPPRPESLTAWRTAVVARMAPRREDARIPEVELRRRLHGGPPEAGQVVALESLVIREPPPRLVVLAGDEDRRLLARHVMWALCGGGGGSVERIPIHVDLSTESMVGAEVLATTEHTLASWAGAEAAEGLARTLAPIAAAGQAVLVVEGYDGRPGMLGALARLELDFPRVPIVVFARPVGFHYLLHYDVVGGVDAHEYAAPDEATLEAAMGTPGHSGEALAQLVERLRHEPEALDLIRGRWVHPRASLEAAARVHYALSAADRLGDEDAFFAALGRPRRRGGADAAQVPGGTFTLGSPRGGFYVEAPEHPVTLPTFWLGRRPVTRGEFAEFAPEHTCYGGPRHPVTEVSWYVARLYAHWRGGRLPTEAEWEHACRLAAPKPQDAWLYPASNGATRSVDVAEPAGLGLCDLLGQVAEWCLDWHGVYPPFPRVHPAGRWSGHARVCRGGSKDATECWPSWRGHLAPWEAFDGTGFRLAWSEKPD